MAYATPIHLKSTNKAALEAFIEPFKCALAPKEGRLAVPETTDAEGNTIEAQPAIGEVGTFYTTILIDQVFEFALDAGIETADEETVAQLCGKWA